ncbi:MAG: DoxX family protein [Bacteroidia bacterium]
MRYIELIGRVFYSLIFLMTVTFHFSHAAVEHAQAQHVPAASFLVPFSGILATLGAISIMLGYRTRVGAMLIVIFLVPVTIMMHAFWMETDPMHAQMQMSNFMKNLALLGAALIISYFGAGPVSFDFKNKTV